MRPRRITARAFTDRRINVYLLNGRCDNGFENRPEIRRQSAFLHSRRLSSEKIGRKVNKIFSI